MKRVTVFLLPRVRKNKPSIRLKARRVPIESESLSTVRLGKFPKAQKSTGKPTKTDTAGTRKFLFLVSVIGLSPRNDNWNGFLGRDRNRVHRTIHAAQVTDLAIGRVLDHRLVCFQIETKYVGRTRLHASPATDAPADTFDRHSLPLFMVIIFLNRRLLFWTPVGSQPCGFKEAFWGNFFDSEKNMPTQICLGWPEVTVPG